MGENRITRPITTVYRTWLRHPRWSLATRGAVAAGIAWLVGIVAPAPLSEYPYYAPLGAVIATTSTLVRSVRDSVQVTLAVLVGAGIARAADAFLSPGALSVALVVGASLLLSGWRLFGEMGNWVATSAIFVLILGDVEALEYVGSFAGLVAVGAAIGVGVNLVLPPLPLTPADNALDRLGDVLIDQVVDLIDDLEHAENLSVDDWDHRRRSLHQTLDQTRRSVERTREAVRANPRVRRYRRWTEDQEARTLELETVTAAVDQLVSLLVDTAERVDLGEVLRRAFVDALRAFADVLRADAGDPDRDEMVTRLDDAVRDLGRKVRAEDPPESADLVAGALVLALQRAARVFRA